MAKTIGVDVGGSWMRVGVLDPAAGPDVGPVEKYPSPVDWDRFAETLARYNGPDVGGYAVAIAGPIKDHATVVKGPNLPWLDGCDVRAGLGKALGGKQVVVSNDMEAATEGEIARGVLKGYRWAIFDTISTGWGGNLILDGVRVDGEPGHAHAGIDSPIQCGCGNFGCFETLYSGTAMERRIAAGMQCSFAVPPDGVGAWDFFYQQAEAGAPWAVTLMNDWAEGVGRAWANVMNRVRPLQAIVYMGTTAESLLYIPRVEGRLRATLQRVCAFPEHKAPGFPILQGRESNRALYGALAIYDRLS